MVYGVEMVSKSRRQLLRQDLLQKWAPIRRVL
jgi:hypothetical protein